MWKRPCTNAAVSFILAKDNGFAKENPMVATPSTPPEKSIQEHAVYLRSAKSLAQRIGLPESSVLAIAEHGQPNTAPLLIKVLGVFAGGFSWEKAFAVLHSDGMEAQGMIQQVADDSGIELPPKPFAESHMS